MESWGLQLLVAKARVFRFYLQTLLSKDWSPKRRRCIESTLPVKTQLWFQLSNSTTWSQVTYTERQRHTKWIKIGSLYCRIAEFKIWCFECMFQSEYSFNFCTLHCTCLVYHLGFRSTTCDWSTMHTYSYVFPCMYYTRVARGSLVGCSSGNHTPGRQCSLPVGKTHFYLQRFFLRLFIGSLSQSQ